MRASNKMRKQASESEENSTKNDDGGETHKYSVGMKVFKSFGKGKNKKKYSGTIAELGWYYDRRTYRIEYDDDREVLYEEEVTKWIIKRCKSIG